MDPIMVICATRHSMEDFKKSYLGRSLCAFRLDHVSIQVVPENTQGLGDIYNAFIEHVKYTPRIMLFIHDDVFVLDMWWADRLREALRTFDIVGIAGNKVRHDCQANWMYRSSSTMDDENNFSGMVAHGDVDKLSVSIYGPSRTRVKLIDGLFMACHSTTFHKHNLRFDPQFKFHFYDMDLCRAAEQKGLAIGTWDISVVHQSAGNLNCDDWETSYKTYLTKWGS